MEAKARERLHQVSMTRLGTTISVNSPPLGDSGHRRGSLVVEPLRMLQLLSTHPTVLSKYVTSSAVNARKQNRRP